MDISSGYSYYSFINSSILEINNTFFPFWSINRFQDKIQVNIVDGPPRIIPVTAYGYGTTIVTNPPMSPTLNLGPHFSKGPCKRTFTLTNMGRRHQALVWSTEGFTFLNKPKPRHGELRPINPKDMKFKVCSQDFFFIFILV